MRCLNAAMVVFVLCFAANAHADYAAGFAAYDRGDHVTAFKEWKQSAEQGDAKSQYELALLYQDGVGTRKDIAEAIKWYREAAARGLAPAQNNLGVLYSKGLGVAQDHAEAAKWYYKAAKGGSLEALFSLGLAFEKGRGVEQDYNVAALNYLAAAEHGYASAQANLSILYAANVPGVPIDYPLAYKWSSLAIPALNGEIQKRVIRHRDTVAAKL